MDRVYDDETGQPNIYLQPFPPRWREAADLAERRTESALARRRQRIVLSRCERGDDGGADRLDESFSGRVVQDAFSDRDDQHQQHVHGDQGWTAILVNARSRMTPPLTPLTVMINWTSTLQK
jgi:hypothetical protein